MGRACMCGCISVLLCLVLCRCWPSLSLNWDSGFGRYVLARDASDGRLKLRLHAEPVGGGTAVGWLRPPRLHTACAHRRAHMGARLGDELCALLRALSSSRL